MKTCPTCGETYSNRIEFCFAEGEVLVDSESIEDLSIDGDASLPGQLLAHEDEDDFEEVSVDELTDPPRKRHLDFTPAPLQPISVARAGFHAAEPPVRPRTPASDAPAVPITPLPTPPPPPTSGPAGALPQGGDGTNASGSMRMPALAAASVVLVVILGLAATAMSGAWTADTAPAPTDSVAPAPAEPLAADSDSGGDSDSDTDWADTDTGDTDPTDTDGGSLDAAEGEPEPEPVPAEAAAPAADADAEALRRQSAVLSPNTPADAVPPPEPAPVQPAGPASGAVLVSYTRAESGATLYVDGAVQTGPWPHRLELSAGEHRFEVALEDGQREVFDRSLSFEDEQLVEVALGSK